MAHIGINEVIELKKQVEESYGNTLHLHDACGGQYFSTDKPISGELKEYLTEYFKQKKLKVTFPSDHQSFVLNRPF